MFDSIFLLIMLVRKFRDFISGGIRRVFFLIAGRVSVNTLLFIVVTAVFVIVSNSTLLLVPVDGALFSSNKTSLETGISPLPHVPEFIRLLG